MTKVIIEPDESFESALKRLETMEDTEANRLRRIDAVVNGRKSVSAFIDSGAVLSIVSRKVASELPVRMLGTFEEDFRPTPSCRLRSHDRTPV